MMLSRRDALAAGAGMAAIGLTATCRPAAAGETFEVAYTDAEWKARLSADQFAVLRKAGTELPFTSPLNGEHRRGRFVCAGCDRELFASETKFDSGTGWPSFWAPLDGAVGQGRDTSWGVSREEIHCARCGGHLGHAFADGPKPTGLRYCMNGVAMTFKPLAA